jgi:hypothetical protein
MATKNLKTSLVTVARDEILKMDDKIQKNDRVTVAE